MTKEYAEYLCSEEWGRKRVERLRIGNGRCAVCGVGGGIDVHHLTYARIFDEEMGDLLPLCRKHHEVVEGLIRSGELGREGDVMYLATETVRVVLGKEIAAIKAAKVERADDGGGKFRVMVNGILARKEIQVDMLRDERFVRLLGLPEKRFKEELRRLYHGNPNKGKLMGNGMGIYVREQGRKLMG